MDIFLSKPGVFCVAGDNAEQLWQACVSGNQKGIKKTQALDGQDFFVARIDEKKLLNSSARYDMRIMKIEECALLQIEKSINLCKEKYGAKRIAVCVGSCDNGTEFSVAGHEKFFNEGKFPDDYSLEIQGADYVSTFISEKYGLEGPAATFSSACSSSAGAIVKGAELLMADLADAVIAGGVDIASDTTLIGFNSLEAISNEITNPFSKNRKGITLGDGAAFFIMTKELLEENQTPVKLLGYGESSDAYHMTSPDPSGAGAESAMRKALNRASLKPEQIDYINLHGTGTRLNDMMEATAVNKIFGDKVLCSTSKPITGHTLGAAGAMGLSICYMAICENLSKSEKNVMLPIQVWDEEYDEEIPHLNIVSKSSKIEKSEIKICAANAFAFGGANSCLVIGI